MARRMKRKLDESDYKDLDILKRYPIPDGSGFKAFTRVADLEAFMRTQNPDCNHDDCPCKNAPKKFESFNNSKLAQPRYYCGGCSSRFVWGGKPRPRSNRNANASNKKAPDCGSKPKRRRTKAHDQPQTLKKPEAIATPQLYSDYNINNIALQDLATQLDAEEDQIVVDDEQTWRLARELEAAGVKCLLDQSTVALVRQDGDNAAFAKNGYLVQPMEEAAALNDDAYGAAVALEFENSELEHAESTEAVTEESAAFAMEFEDQQLVINNMEQQQQQQASEYDILRWNAEVQQVRDAIAWAFRTDPSLLDPLDLSDLDDTVCT